MDHQVSRKTFLLLSTNTAEQIKPTWVYQLKKFKKEIQHGVRKVNVDTDIRLAMTGAVRQYLTEHPEAFDPRDYLKPARDKVVELLTERMQAFGQPATRETTNLFLLRK
jgi:hypothetical protein